MDEKERDAKPPRLKSTTDLANLEELAEGLIKGGSAAWSPSKHKSGGKHNCLCAPTTHAGSFRCRLHRNTAGVGGLRRGYSVGSNLSEMGSKHSSSGSQAFPLQPRLSSREI